MPEFFLSAVQISDALGELAQRISSRGEGADIYVVGGAALCVAYGARDATRDVDTFYSNPLTVEACVAELAAEHEWPRDWLNNRAQAFAPLVADDPAPIRIVQAGDFSDG